jgi:hypothetical protein
MFTAFLTRFADMADVLSRTRWGSRWSWIGAFVGLAGLMLIDPSPAPGQEAGTKGQPSGKAAASKDANADDKENDAAPDVDDAVAADPSKTQRVAPVEVFKDPNAEAIVGIKSLTTLPPVPFTNQDVLSVKDMASNPNRQLNRSLIDQVVKGLAAKLTDRKSVQSLLEGPPEEAPKGADLKKGAAVKKAPAGDGGKAIQQATTDLLEPIFLAKGAKNDQFLRDYRRSLHQFLPPLLKNHLVPRVQAMIVLGQAGTPTQEALQLFLTEISSRSQTLWVKLWAIEGIINIRRGGTPFSNDIESKAARTIANFLETEKDLPWLIQLRGLEALGALRRAHLPTEASKAQMANTAMLFLADGDAKVEVRAEAARALGLMQVNAVPNYNFSLVAYGAGLLAADIASQINEQYEDNPPRVHNRTKVQYLTALLVGPVFQSFAGTPGENNSGILVTGRADAAATKYDQKVFDLVRPLAQSSVTLLTSPTRDYKKRKQELAESVAALRGYLVKNPPPSRRLVAGGREYGAGGGAAAGAWDRPDGQVGNRAVAGVGRGR